MLFLKVFVSLTSKYGDCFIKFPKTWLCREKVRNLLVYFFENVCPSKKLLYFCTRLSKELSGQKFFRAWPGSFKKDFYRS